MIALYISVFSFVSLLFQYINYVFPDPLSYVTAYSDAMRYDIASLVILFPVFLLLMHLIRADITRVPEKHELWVRRWALVLTIFVAGATIATELISLINNFLGGDLTTPFILKASIVLLVAIAGFLHFLADMRGYWDSHQTKLRAVGIAILIAIICAIIAGFIIMGSPAQTRLYRFDDQKISDLQQIEWLVADYAQQKHTLPTTIGDLHDPNLGYSVPQDSQHSTAYEYQKRSDSAYTICATFNAETHGTIPPTSVPIGPYGAIKQAQENWYHAAGHNCFNRSVTFSNNTNIPTQIK